jgi:ketosteroid isomerase-like protein
MSQEDVELLRQAIDAVNRGDKALWLALCDPEIENVPPREWPESESIRGAEAVWDFFVQGNAPWEGGAYEQLEVIDAGNGRIATQLHRDVQGKASGAPVTWSFWQVVESRNGKGVRIEWFTERSEALKAVGLAE